MSIQDNEQPQETLILFNNPGQFMDCWFERTPDGDRVFVIRRTKETEVRQFRFRGEALTKLLAFLEIHKEE